MGNTWFEDRNGHDKWIGLFQNAPLLNTLISIVRARRRAHIFRNNGCALAKDALFPFSTFLIRVITFILNTFIIIITAESRRTGFSPMAFSRINTCHRAWATCLPGFRTGQSGMALTAIDALPRSTHIAFKSNGATVVREAFPLVFAFEI